MDTHTDYRDQSNWLALPGSGAEAGAGAEASAGTQAGAGAGAQTGAGASPFDVFYLYPTTCSRNDVAFCENDDAAMRKGAVLKLRQQGSIFAAGNLYAPFYRQLSMARFPQLGSIAAIRQEVDRVVLPEVQAAFLHYLEISESSRPLMFAGHSQGTIVLLSLLAWLRATCPKVLDRTIAAYLIGFTVTPADLKAIGLGAATGPDDTAVVISYNTERTATSGFNPLIWAKDALVINPVNWRTDATPASPEESLGSRLPGKNGLLHDHWHFASATLDLSRRTLTTDAPVQAHPPWPDGVLHSLDLALFYHDLRANVSARAAAWFAKAHAHAAQ
jgi:hypothetical protein